MAAVRMSESLDVRSSPYDIKFSGGGEDMAKRSSPLPPPPLLLSAATASDGDHQGKSIKQHHRNNPYQIYQSSPSPHHHHHQGDQQQRRYFKEEVITDERDSVASSTPSPSSDAFPPVKFNILGKMQMRILSKSLNSSLPQQPQIKSTHPHLNSQSDPCNRDENKSPLISSNKQPSHSSPQQSPTTTTNTVSKNSNNATAPQNQARKSRSTGQQQRPPSGPQPVLHTPKHKISSHHHQNNNNSDQLTSSADSPLDFSTKKLKLDHGLSPSSRLRNILSMKSPDAGDNFSGAILNLSKADSPLYDHSPNDDHKKGDPWYNNVESNRSDSRSASRSSSNYSSSSPKADRRNQSMNSQTEDMDEEDSDHIGHIQQQRAFLSSPRLPSQSAMSLTTPVNGNPLNFTPFGSVFANSNLSQMSQSAAATLPLQIPQFDTSPPMFSHHISASAASPTLPFDTGVTPVSSMTSSNNKARATRPFKAYPKDPMSFSAVGLYGLPLGTTPGSTEALLHQQSNIAYAEFRKQMLNQSQMNKTRRGGQRNNNGLPPLTNGMLASPNSGNDSITFGHRMDGGANSSAEDSHSAPEDSCKSSGGKTEQQMKDEAYWERRRKNNEAAKRSRDARRAKEDEIAIRAAFLEQENLKLRFELCALKNETAKLRCMLYSS